MELNLWVVVRLRDDAVRPDGAAIDQQRFMPVRLLAAMPRLPRAHLAWLATWLFQRVKGATAWRMVDQVAAIDWSRPLPWHAARQIQKARQRLAEVQKMRNGRRAGPVSVIFAAWSMVVLGLESEDADAEVLAGIVVAEALGLRPDLFHQAVETYKALVQCAEDGLPPQPELARRRAAHHRDLTEFYSGVPGAATTRTVRTSRWAVQRALALGWTLDELAQGVGSTRQRLLDVLEGQAVGAELGDTLHPFAERLNDDLVYAIQGAADTWESARAYLVSSRTLARKSARGQDCDATPWLPGA